MRNSFGRTIAVLLIGAVIGGIGTYSALSKAKAITPGASSKVESVLQKETSSLASMKTALQAKAAGVSSASTSSGAISYYFPRGNEAAEPQLVKAIGSAKSKLDMAIYSFTDTNIASAVISDKKRGVAVRVITDRECASNSYQKRVLSELKGVGIPVKYNTHSGLMHLKVSIIDSTEVTTGSFNYTKSAEDENDEVLVILKDSNTAKDFDAQFNRMWADTKNFANY